ncbi:MAG: hypothetical protein ROO76_04005, partial [Terriglobia bacterium]|nr:hypothetical protein [Terriglobia bacterium]
LLSRSDYQFVIADEKSLTLSEKIQSCWTDFEKGLCLLKNSFRSGGPKSPSRQDAYKRLSRFSRHFWSPKLGLIFDIWDEKGLFQQARSVIDN